MINIAKCHKISPQKFKYIRLFYSIRHFAFVTMFPICIRFLSCLSLLHHGFIIFLFFSSYSSFSPFPSICFSEHNRESILNITPLPAHFRFCCHETESSGTPTWQIIRAVRQVVYANSKRSYLYTFIVNPKGHIYTPLDTLDIPFGCFVVCLCLWMLIDSYIAYAHFGAQIKIGLAPEHGYCNRFWYYRPLFTSLVTKQLRRIKL